MLILILYYSLVKNPTMICLVRQSSQNLLAIMNVCQTSITYVQELSFNHFDPFGFYDQLGCVSVMLGKCRIHRSQVCLHGNLHHKNNMMEIITMYLLRMMQKYAKNDMSYTFRKRTNFEIESYVLTRKCHQTLARLKLVQSV